MADPRDFTDDYPDMSPGKVARRVSFIEDSIRRYMSHHNAEARKRSGTSPYVFDLDNPNLVVMPAEIMNAYHGYRKLIGHMVAHGASNPRIDRHKIIAGKQAAVMMAAPLRVRAHAGLTDARLDDWRNNMVDDKPYLNLENVDSKDLPFVYTMRLNAGFAFSLGVDILLSWNRLQQNAAGFIAQNASLFSCYTRLLLNTFVSQSARPTHDCCFFWCSHLWFMLEEKLLASAGRR